MEIAGVVLGAVGLLALYKDAARKVHSFKHFSSETQRLTSRYNATKILFERWGKKVGIAADDAKGMHPQLNDQATAAAVASLLTSICDGFGAATSVLPDSGPTKPNIKDRLKWAVADGSKFADQVDNFEGLVQKLYLLIPLESLQTDQFQKLHDALVESQRFHILSRISHWLNAPSSEEGFEAYRATRLDTTCNWITIHPAYMDWLCNNTNSSAVLWIHGPAGFGKSVLCAYIVQSLRDAGSSPVYSFFCSTDDESLSDPSSILRSWIYQAVCYEEHVLDMVIQYLESCEKATATYFDLWHLLHKILARNPNAIYVVDGFDECPRSTTTGSYVRHGREDMLHDLVDSIADSGGRLLVVSRDESDIKSELGLHALPRSGLTLYELSITKDMVSLDVSKFAEYVVTQRLPGKSGDFQQQLAAQMASKCDGMFLWIRLQGRNLRPLKGNKQLQRSVNEMPTDLVRIYERDWLDIQGFSESDRQRAQTILRWVTFARRPLTIAELSEAVAVLDIDDADGPIFDELPDPFDDKYVYLEVLGLCGSFLELRSANTAEWGHETVHLIHFTAVEFLSGQHTGGPLSDQALQNYHLARDCLRYIDNEASWRVEEGTGSNVIYKRPFSSYAVLAWHEHLVKSMQYRHKLQPKVLSFFDLPNSSWDHWRDSYETAWTTGTKAVRTSRNDLQIRFKPGPRLYYAALFGFREIVEYLHNVKGADKDEIGGRHGTPVQAASANGHIDVLLYLLNIHSDITIHGVHGSALHTAAACDQKQSVKELLQHGASISAINKRGRTSLSTAASFGNLGVAQILINHGAEISIPDGHGFVPLHFAVQSGDTEMVRLLLKKGADSAVTSEEGHAPLHISAWHGYTDISKLLLKEGGDINLKSIHGDTALACAALGGHVKMCQLLLESGADPLARNRFGTTALHLAARHGHHELAKVFLDSGMDLSPVDCNERTPLHFAARCGHHTILTILLDSGASFTAPDKYGNTILHCAALHGAPDIVKHLLDCGADFSATDAGGWTPLFSACAQGNVDAARILIEFGADVNARATNRGTPLHVAFKNQQESVIMALLDNHASMDCLDCCGIAPWQYGPPEFRIKIPQCVNGNPPTRSYQQECSRQTLSHIAQLVSPWKSKDPGAMDALGRSLLVVQDLAAASVALDESIRINSKTGKTFHWAHCDKCQYTISGKRYICTTCPNFDLCVPCMNDYEGSCGLHACAAQDFLRVPSEAWSIDKVNDVYTEEFVRWLEDVAMRHGVEGLSVRH